MAQSDHNKKHLLYFKIFWRTVHVSLISELIYINQMITEVKFTFIYTLQWIGQLFPINLIIAKSVITFSSFHGIIQSQLFSNF
jgi:hypothetical protein